MALPTEVHNCLYLASLLDIQTFVAFAHCKQIDGGEECVRAIPAGLNCLNSNGTQLPNLGNLDKSNFSY